MVRTLIVRKLVVLGNKKAPRTFQSKTPRQPSPRTAKPLLDSRVSSFPCKRHFGNPSIPDFKTNTRMERLEQNSTEGLVYYGFLQLWPVSLVAHCSPVEVASFPCWRSVN